MRKAIFGVYQTCLPQQEKSGLRDIANLSTSTSDHRSSGYTKSVYFNMRKAVSGLYQTCLLQQEKGGLRGVYQTCLLQQEKSGLRVIPNLSTTTREKRSLGYTKPVYLSIEKCILTIVLARRGSKAANGF